MTSAAFSMLIGYLIGGISPAAMVGAAKKKNLREVGSKNLGATNVTLSVGKRYGFAVMILDIFKSFISVRIARFLFPHLAIAGLLAGGSAVVGHIYPVYMRFKGGKGLAAFGGLILALDPLSFLILLTLGVVLSFAVDHALALPLSAAVTAPFLVGLRTQDLAVFALVCAVSVLLLYKHRENVALVRSGGDKKLSEYLKKSDNE